MCDGLCDCDCSSVRVGRVMHGVSVRMVYTDSRCTGFPCVWFYADFSLPGISVRMHGISVRMVYADFSLPGTSVRMVYRVLAAWGFCA